MVIQREFFSWAPKFDHNLRSGTQIVIDWWLFGAQAQVGGKVKLQKVLLNYHPDLYNHRHKVGQPSVHVFTLVVNTWESNGETFTASKGIWAEGGVAIRSFYVVV